MFRELDRQKRRFVRIRTGYMAGTVQIVKVGNVDVESAAKRVAIHDISAGGLRFSTDLRFPLHAQITLGFYVKFLDPGFRLQGLPVWMRQTENVFEYGVAFALTEKQTILLNGKLAEWVAGSFPNRFEIAQMYRKLADDYARRHFRSGCDFRV